MLGGAPANQACSITITATSAGLSRTPTGGSRSNSRAPSSLPLLPAVENRASRPPTSHQYYAMESDTTDHRNSTPITFWAVAVLVFGLRRRSDAAGAERERPCSCAGSRSMARSSGSERLFRDKIGHEPSGSEPPSNRGAEMLGSDGWDTADEEALELLAAKVDEVEEGFAAITRISDKPPGGIHRHQSTARWQGRALAENRPRLAAQIEKLGERRDSPEELHRLKIVQSLRACSEPREALAALATFREENGANSLRTLGKLFDTLALESGELDPFFEIGPRPRNFEMAEQRPPEEMRAAIDKLITAGTHAGAHRRALTTVVTTTSPAPSPASSVKTQIIEARNKTPDFDDPDFRHVATAAASSSAGTGSPDRSFDLYRKLAAIGALRRPPRMCRPPRPPAARIGDGGTPRRLRPDRRAP